MNTNIQENNFPFYRRFFIYQQERFPLLGHGLMIAAFTFSAISYSRLCRSVEGFIDWGNYLIGIFATVSLFFLVRIFDEFKDQEDDAKYRKYLPVPRGLISLKELRIIGWILAIFQVGIIGYFQTQMLYLYLIVLAYLLLMSVEFFVADWLRERQILYITSHMFIIPLVDIYASGLDWLLEGDQPHWGLAWFFAVSYMNGLVLEFGRKLKTKEQEEPGVVSYTKMYGEKGGVYIWLGLLLATMGLAIGAGYYAGFTLLGLSFFVLLFLICAIPGLLFISKPSPKTSKQMEIASALWTALMYLSLGGIPMVIELL